jgi:hypothetical protein
VKDYELVAEVFDGGWGWVPELPAALVAWNRMQERYGCVFMDNLITRWIAVKHG